MRPLHSLIPALLLVTAPLLTARDYGLPIGSKMPDFEATAQDGKVHTLRALLGPKGAVVLFFRSADW
jgi:hypothetical protein